MSKFIEIDVKNKKHTECCDVLSTAMDEMETHHKALEDIKKSGVPSDVEEQIDAKINDLRFKKVILRDKAKRCGCRAAYQPTQ